MRRRDVQIAADMEEKIGAKFSCGHAYMNDIGVNLKLRDGKVKIDTAFTPEEVVQIVNKIKEMQGLA
jgi:hypothetical protein